MDAILEEFRKLAEQVMRLKQRLLMTSSNTIEERAVKCAKCGNEQAVVGDLCAFCDWRENEKERLE